MADVEEGVYVYIYIYIYWEKFCVLLHRFGRHVSSHF